MDEARLRPINVELSNQQVVELAYAVMELIEPLARTHAKLYFEQANGYLSCFYLMRGLLGNVDPDYLDQHKDLARFFRQDRELDNAFDRLKWVN
jgi:hypothetical protein